MSKLKKYNMKGKSVGEVTIDKAFTEAQANGQMIKDYIITLRNNARQWSANTKTRAEVNHSNKKPHAQKGTGKARQGALSTPQYKGGGRAFGPRPKFDQSIKLNKKERRAAIRFLIAEKIRGNNVFILENFDMDEPKTKTITHFLKEFGIEGKRTLFLGESSYEDIKHEGETARVHIPSDKHQNMQKSVRNIQKTNFALACNVNGYDVILANNLILTESALQELQQWLS